MVSYFIHLRNPQGQDGYFVFENPPGFSICNDISGACPFETEEAAEKCLYELEGKYGLDREEGHIESKVVDDTFALRLGGIEDEDGISVMREGEKRYIVVQNVTSEAGEELPDDVADLLVRVLWKIDQRLGKR